MTAGSKEMRSGVPADGFLTEVDCRHGVDIWVYSLNIAEAELDRFRSYLSNDELQRAARFIQSSHGEHFIAARGGLRRILSGYLGCEPEALIFEISETGKPYLRLPVSGGEPVHFNLTHSGGVAAVAVCGTAQVGIDIEKVRPVHQGLARRYFAAEEVAGIEARTGQDAQLETFFRCWTRKEAFVKATGEGIRRGLDSFVVSLGGDDVARVESIDGSKQAGRDYCLLGFTPGEGFAGAVCVATGGPENGADFTLRKLL